MSRDIENLKKSGFIQNNGNNGQFYAKYETRLNLIDF